MTTSVIIDDIAEVRQTLRIMLEDYCGDLVSVVGEADGVKSGISIIEQVAPQVVFLDIRLGMGNGFDILAHFQGKGGFEVIFVTDYQEYAMRAFEVAAVGYVLKPISIEFLQKYVRRAVERIALNEPGRSIQTLMDNHQKSSQEQTINLPLRDGKLGFLRIADIVYCQAMEKHSLVVAVGKPSPIITTRNLGKLEDTLLAFGFHRIHHGFLVNETHLREYDKQSQRVTMSNGQRLEVSERKRNKFLEKFLKIAR